MHIICKQNIFEKNTHNKLCFVSTDDLLLSDNVRDYHFVSQGKITINGVDDAEEMLATHVCIRKI